MSSRSTLTRISRPRAPTASRRSRLGPSSRTERWPRPSSVPGCRINRRFRRNRTYVPDPRLASPRIGTALTNTTQPRYTRGDISEMLPNIKSQMARLGLAVGDTESADFDRPFELGARQFQQDRGILCDGVLGAETL